MLESLTCRQSPDELRHILLVPDSQRPLLQAYRTAACNRSSGLRKDYFGQLAAELKDQLDAQKIISQVGVGRSHVARGQASGSDP